MNDEELFEGSATAEAESESQIQGPPVEFHSSGTEPDIAALPEEVLVDHEAPSVPLLSEAEAGPLALSESSPSLSPTEPVASASPPSMAVHAEATIKAWFADTFTNMIATGRIREREVEALLQDLLRRLALRS
jgi:hypothetical protein